MGSANDSAPLIRMNRDGVEVVALNREQARNAIDEGLRNALIATLEELAADKAVRAVVLTGEGSAFSAGGDIRAMRKRLETDPGAAAVDGWRHQRTNTHRLVMTLAGFPKPCVAAVNGAAAGLGADLALACDSVIASRRARFAYSYALRGLIPDGGGMFFLPRRVGLARARELIFTGRTVEADEALAIGLADAIVEAEELIDTAVAQAHAYTAGSPTAFALAKSILTRSHEMSLEDVLSAGAAAQGICYASPEHRAAVTAFFAARGG